MLHKKKDFWTGIGCVLAFILWTIAVCFLDVQAIGPQGSTVGLATLNGLVREWFGNNLLLYIVTDWLGLVPIGVAFGFALLGLVQWIRRKSICKVDYSLFVLGGFYLVVIAVYVFFEMVVINYRPVLIEGYLETSYPSSTTMLVTCVMPTAIMQLRARIKNKRLSRCITVGIVIFTIFMVVGRIVSGVHWITDIIGGALISAGLVLIYHSVSTLEQKKDA